MLACGIYRSKTLYGLSICVLSFIIPLPLCVCSCVVASMYCRTCACMWGSDTKSCAGRHKAGPHPPLPLPGGEDTVCPTACSQQEGGWGSGEEVVEVVGWGQSSHVYWLEVSVGMGMVTSGIRMLIWPHHGLQACFS